MRYLVTGGAGFIGSHLVDRLAARGDEVLVLDDLSTGRRENFKQHDGADRVELVEGSMLDAELVDECLRGADACVHLASAVGVELIVRRPLQTLLTNVRGNDIVISAAARHGARLLFASTSEIYGKNGAHDLAETSDRVLGSPFRARWSYSTAKAFGESLVHAYALEQGCDMIAVRLFNTTGPRQSAAYGMVLPRFVQQALRGDPLTVYGDGRQSRCFLHVADAVDAVVRVLDEPAASGRVFNVGSSHEVRVIDLARLVIDIVGSPSDIEFVAYEDAYGPEFEELGRRRPDATALQQATGWTPRRTLHGTIEDLVAFERAAAKDDGVAADVALVADLRPSLDVTHPVRPIGGGGRVG